MPIEFVDAARRGRIPLRVIYRVSSGRRFVITLRADSRRSYASMNVTAARERRRLISYESPMRALLFVRPATDLRDWEHCSQMYVGLVSGFPRIAVS